VSTNVVPSLVNFLTLHFEYKNCAHHFGCCQLSYQRQCESIPAFAFLTYKKDCQAHNLNREDAVDRGRWKKLIKIV